MGIRGAAIDVTQTGADAYGRQPAIEQQLGGAFAPAHLLGDSRDRQIPAVPQGRGGALRVSETADHLQAMGKRIERSDRSTGSYCRPNASASTLASGLIRHTGSVAGPQSDRDRDPATLQARHAAGRGVAEGAGLVLDAKSGRR